MSKSYSMRRAAFQAVRGWADRGWRVETSITRIRESQGLAVRDVATASDIAATVIKRLASIDAVLSAYCTRKRSRVEQELWTLAQVGAAQILFRPDIRAHAAVFETVAVADEIDKPQWKGFLNGLLRSIARSVRFQDEINFVDGLQSVATQSFDGRRWAVLDQTLTDGGPSDSEWLSRVYSLPRWLTRRWLGADWNGGAEQLDRFLRRSNAQPRQWVRVNLMRQSRDQLQESVQAAFPDVVVESGEVTEAIAIAGPVTLSELPGFSDGSCSVQDQTAMRAVDRLAPRAGERILDLCAAPGGKTGHIAERLRGEGSVVAADIAESRLRRVQENIERLRLDNVEICLIDRQGNVLEGPQLGERAFDAAIVDVPCSNTGVLAKRPEARWRIKETDLDELPAIQQELLGRAATHVRGGGRLLYSTCSVEPEENRHVVDQFLTSNTSWRLAADELSLPSENGDGGYHALLTS